MATKYLDNTGLAYFWGKIKSWVTSRGYITSSGSITGNAATATRLAGPKHSYTTAANAAKNWYRIANANTHQMDTSKPLQIQFMLTAWNPDQPADYYLQWFVDCQVYGRNSGIRIFGTSGAPFNQARVLYENTVANIDSTDRPAIDIYLNYVLTTACQIRVEEIYNSGWTFVADGVLSSSTIPSGFEGRAVGCYASGVSNAGFCDYAARTRLGRSNITANTTLANNDTYRARVLNCTNAITITVPSIDSDYAWFLIKNFNAASTNKDVTIHPSTTSVLIDDSNADIVLKPGEWVIIASKATNSYTLISDGRWKSQKADKATTLAGYGITDAKIASGTITLGTSTITPLTSGSTLDATKLSGTASIDTTGNAGTATKLATSRTISLTGDVSGSASFDGSANASITATVADDSHNHVISNVDGLQTALDGKAGKATTIAGYGITDAKIANGTITLGSSSITPLTSHQALPTLSKTDSGSGNAVTGISVSNHAITVTKGATFAEDSDVMHLTGDEAIEGIKEFSNSYHDSDLTPSVSDYTSSSVVVRIPDYDKGTVPTTHHHGNLVILDKDGTNFNWNGRLGLFEYSVSPDVGNITRMSCYKNEVVDGVDAHDYTYLGVGYDTNGEKYAYAPSTSTTRTAGTDILTRDWIPNDDRIVHSSGDEAIAGTKTFSSTISGSIDGNAATATRISGPKHSYTTAANAAKGWYRIANANTSQLDTSKPIHVQFILTAYNASYAADYYERWFVNAIVFGRTANIVVYGGSNVPFSQIRVLYENTVASIDANDRPAIDIYLNYVLPNGSTKIEVEEVYNNGGWTFLADGQLAASSVPSGFENVACSVRSNGVERSTYADYVPYLNRQISNVTAAFTLADSNTYRSHTLNCTGTFTITVPSINSGYMWCVIKNKNATSGVITLHPSTTSVKIDNSNADITLQPGEYVCIHSAGANNYSLIADGRWMSQKANAVLTGYSKPSSTSAIAATDTVPAAIGKLEKALDAKAADSGVVHTSGDEQVAGAKVFTSAIVVGDIIRRTMKDGLLLLSSGDTTNVDAGAKLYLYGSENSIMPGEFNVQAGLSSSAYYQLKGTPAGSLTWGGVDITGDVHSSGNETIAGEKTFSSCILTTSNATLRHTDASGFVQIGFAPMNNGPRINLFGKNSSTYTGQVQINSYDGTSSKSIFACPDGTLTWNGQAIQVASDERLKTPISAVPDDVLDAWGDVQWGQFQFLDAVDCKGKSKARLHLGLIAQRVKAAFEAKGLDACAYGILCHDVRPAKPAEIDEHGETVFPAEDAVDLWTVRYAEAQAMEAAYQRRRADMLERRLADLEARMTAMEAANV